MYQVLYRKYRPKVFSDVYGQDHVTETLKNEIKDGRISHAYLFTGSRGTGKTTCAKILAKAVNCENHQDGEPCNECEVCKGLESGAIYDVVEIDAASNNGVDNIRELRDDANYTPSRGKYRVYIIDEVHMLSTGAFNALLKTLEEPPAHVIFILATTEVHKLPATILSRCQRFDFKRIQPETMAARLRQVASAEGMELDDGAAVLIARIADGALRDGLSVLDQCAGRSKHITEKLVSEVAGLAGRETLYRLCEAVSKKNSTDAMQMIDRLYQNSYDMERLCVEMIDQFRNLLVIKAVKKSRELIVCTDDEYDTVRRCAQSFTLENIIFSLDLFQETLGRIKTGVSARIEMEMAFIRLCEPKLETSPVSMLERISALERAMKNGIPAVAWETESAVPSQQKNAGFESEGNEVSPEEAAAALSERGNDPVERDPRPWEAAQTEPAEHRSEQMEFTRWGEFMDAIYKNDIALFGVLNNARGFIRGEFFLIDSPNPTIKEFIKISTHSKAIKQALFDVTGVHYKLGLFKKKSEESEQRDPLEDLISRAQENHITINFQ